MTRNKIVLSILFFLMFLTFFPINAKVENPMDVNIDFWYVEPDNTDDTLISQVNAFATSSGISITVKGLSLTNAISEFKAASLNGTAPVMIQGLATWIPELVTNGLLKVIEKNNFLEEFMAESLRSVSYYEIVNDVINANNILYYGFPQRVDTQAFLYSKTRAELKGAVIPAIDETWGIPAFKTAITKMNDQSDPANKLYGFSFTDLPAGAEPLFYGNNGLKFYNFTVDQDNIAIESNNSIQALQTMYEIVQVNRLTPDYTEQGSALTYKHFAIDGDVASTFGYASEMKKYLSSSQYSDSSKLGMAPVPKENAGSGGSLEVMALMISSLASVDEQTTALNLAKHLTSESVLVDNAKNEYLLPPVWDAYDHADIITNQIIQNFKYLLKDARELPISKYWSSIQSGFAIEVGEMLNGDQNGTIAARAIRIRWSFLLPATMEVAPIPPVGEIKTEPKTSPFIGPEILIFALGLGIILLRRRR